MPVDGTYVTDNIISGYYVSCVTLLPHSRNRGHLEGWGVVFRDAKVYQMWVSRFAAFTSTQEYWDLMRSVMGRTRQECFSKNGFWEVMDRECKAVPGPSMRLRMSKHRRGKKHKMRVRVTE